MAGIIYPFFGKCDAGFFIALLQVFFMSNFFVLSGERFFKKSIAKNVKVLYNEDI